MINEETMYEALVNKDTEYDGLFFAGITSTGIFCRPTCTARKPKRENVEYFFSPKEAIEKGYRPCKICRPLERPGETPEDIKCILDELTADPLLRITDDELRQRGVDPAYIRRWFLRHHGVTFHSFQRMQRINAAYNRVRRGEKIVEAAFESGYDSLSGFTDSFRSLLGQSPTESKRVNVIRLMRLDSPLGPIVAGAVDEGICMLEFSDGRSVDTMMKSLGRLMNASVIQGQNEHLEKLKAELEEYFEGRRKGFTVPVVLAGTEFQKSVWQALMAIPYGQTRSYKAQAEMTGHPGAVRAVANANGCNRISIIVPCHRVIGNDGGLTGYGGGLWRKKFLLELEKRNMEGEYTARLVD